MDVVQHWLQDSAAYLELLQNGLQELRRSYTIAMPSLRQILHQLPLLASLVSVADQQSQKPTQRLLTSCDGDPMLSCPLNLPGLLNPCCFNYPSGHFLLTQFWDTSPPIGPSDSWTIHGLWPDRCTGGFDAFCDHSQSRTPGQIHAILESAAESGSHPDLLTYMTRYWLSNDNQNSNLWSHEWNKHGTCVSTLEPRCYSDSATAFQSQLDTTATDAAILDYFTHATRLFSRLDTHSFLSAHDITPSHSKTYTLSDLEAAIEASASHGLPVTLRCNARHELDEIWYHFLVRGSLRNANATIPHDHENYNDDVFVPTVPDGQISNCPKTGIRYLPKGSGAPTPSWSSKTVTITATATPTTSRIPMPTRPPFTGRGHLKIRILSSDSSSPSTTDATARDADAGCLIRSGTWYRSGACAVYTAQTDIIDSPSNQAQAQAQAIPHTAKKRVETPPPHLFTLRSSLAPCSIITPRSTAKPPRHANSFLCSPTLHTQSIFTSTPSNLTDPSEPNAIDIGLLTYKNSTTFYVDRIPGRFEQVEIYADDGGGEREVRVQVYWEAVS